MVKYSKTFIKQEKIGWGENGTKGNEKVNLYTYVRHNEFNVSSTNDDRVYYGRT